MKPLMLIPPAQAEALYDAQEEAPTSDRFAPLLWLDDDALEDDPRSKPLVAATDTQDRRTGLRRRAA
jgi:hypothetical protein